MPDSKSLQYETDLRFGQFQVGEASLPESSYQLIKVTELSSLSYGQHFLGIPCSVEKAVQEEIAF